MLCFNTFSNFSSFKKNVLRCFEAAGGSEEDEDADDVIDHAYMYAVDPKISKFEITIRDAVLKMACGLSAKMIWPRKDEFTTISEFKNTFIPVVVSGKTLFRSLLV